MANPISEKIKIGTIGELLVQLRLLQHGVQSAPPIKDSGNDLIALKVKAIKLIQVRTTANGIFPNVPGKSKIYDLLAVVKLCGFDRILNLDDTQIFLIPKGKIPIPHRNLEKLSKYKLENVVDKYFS